MSALLGVELRATWRPRRGFRSLGGAVARTKDWRGRAQSVSLLQCARMTADMHPGIMRTCLNQTVTLGFAIEKKKANVRKV